MKRHHVGLIAIALGALLIVNFWAGMQVGDLQGYERGRGDAAKVIRVATDSIATATYERLYSPKKGKYHTDTTLTFIVSRVVCPEYDTPVYNIIAPFGNYDGATLPQFDSIVGMGIELKN